VKRSCSFHIPAPQGALLYSVLGGKENKHISAETAPFHDEFNSIFHSANDPDDILC
jgi:hypothetical protein